MIMMKKILPILMMRIISGRIWGWRWLRWCKRTRKRDTRIKKKMMSTNLHHSQQQQQNMSRVIIHQMVILILFIRLFESSSTPTKLKIKRFILIMKHNTKRKRCIMRMIRQLMNRRRGETHSCINHLRIMNNGSCLSYHLFYSEIICIDRPRLNSRSLSSFPLENLMKIACTFLLLAPSLLSPYSLLKLKVFRMKK